MPRRNKQQKIKADRRKSISVASSDQSRTQSNIKDPQLPVSAVLDQQEITLTKQTKKDLLKTIIIILAIFALEFVIFYATLN